MTDSESSQDKRRKADKALNLRHKKLLWGLLVASLIVYVLIVAGLAIISPLDDHVHLRVKRTVDSKDFVAQAWTNALVIVNFEREYIAGFLMPLVGVGIAILTYILQRGNLPKAIPGLGITLLLGCAVFMTLGLALRTGWVISGDPVPWLGVYADRYLFGPLTAIFFIDAVLLFLYAIWSNHEPRQADSSEDQ